MIRAFPRFAARLGRATLAALAVAGGATAAAACDCMQPPLVPAALKGSDAVFAATVDSVFVEHRGGRWDRHTWAQNARLRVGRSWKGPREGASVVIQTGSGGGDCGYFFGVGTRHLIYANRSPNGTLSTTICTRSQPFPAARADSIELEALKPPRGRR